MKRQPKPITFGQLIDENDVKNNYGFVYKITFSDGSYYIGKKSFQAKVPWQKYQSSQKHVHKLIQLETPTYEILKLCRGKKNLTYWENWYLWNNNVLVDDKSLNKNIGGRFFKRDV